MLKVWAPKSLLRHAKLLFVDTTDWKHVTCDHVAYILKIVKDGDAAITG